MAQLSHNSQGTAGLEDSGTRAALLQFIHQAGAYATLLARALRELEWRREMGCSQKQPLATDTPESQPVKVSITQEEIAAPALPGRSQPLLKGAERLPTPVLSNSPQPRLEGAECEVLRLPYLEPLAPEVVAVSKKEDLMITLQVGGYRVEGKYAGLGKRFNDIPLMQQQAVAIAATGGTPAEPVYIKVKDPYGNKSHLFANAEANNGWTVADSPIQAISPQQIDNDLQRQNTSGMRKLKGIMRELKPEGGPDMFRGRSLTVLTDGDEVIVVDVNSGIVRDVERLDKLGDIGLHAVREAAREAAGAFGIKGSAAQGVASQPRTRKQRELTL